MILKKLVVQVQNASRTTDPELDLDLSIEDLVLRSVPALLCLSKLWCMVPEFYHCTMSDLQYRLLSCDYLKGTILAESAKIIVCLFVW